MFVKKTVLGVLASGRGSNLQAILAAIQSGQLLAEIGVVISDKPGAAVLKRLVGTGIPAVCLDRQQYADTCAFEAALVKELKQYQVELVVLAGFMRILSAGFIVHFPEKIMNIHPALLPSFPGTDAQKQAVAYGVKVSGCTVHFVDAGMDTGPIIAQETVPVLPNDTADSLAERILHVEHLLYPRALSLYCEGRLRLEGRRVQIRERGL